MSEIIRHNQMRSPSGRQLIGTRQRLVDRGDGKIILVTETQSEPCQNCSHPIAQISQMRGRCQACNQISTCSVCDVVCRACTRRLCGRCRRGYTSKTNVYTVCPACLLKLNREREWHLQQAFEHQQLKAASTRHREWVRQQQLRLQAERMQEQKKLQRLKFLLGNDPLK